MTDDKKMAARDISQTPLKWSVMVSRQSSCIKAWATIFFVVSRLRKICFNHCVLALHIFRRLALFILNFVFIYQITLRTAGRFGRPRRTVNRHHVCDEPEKSC